MKTTRQTKKWLVMAQTALAIGATSLAGQAMAQTDPITVQHAKGQATVKSQPAKTVVFDLPTLDIMQVLGVQAAGVPKARFPESLSAYNDQSMPKVGTLFEPDQDAVKKVSPDLIIVGGRSRAKFDDMAKLAPTLDLSVDTQAPLKSIERNTQTLAAIYHKEPEAQAAVKKLNDAVAGLQAKAATAGNAMLILAVGEKTSAFGPGSRFGMIYDVFGFAPNEAVKDLSAKDRHPVKLEGIAKANPDWLFVIDRNAATGKQDKPAREMLENSVIRDTAAAKNNRIVYLDPYNWYIMGSAGLTSMQQNIEQIAAALNAK
ncbi:siderophore ABC transporter substrate-binding protein [Advenella kashmirensis]